MSLNYNQPLSKIIWSAMFTKKFKLRGNTPKINKLKATLTRVIDEGGSSEEIL